MNIQNKPIGTLLVESGVISQTILDEVLSKKDNYPGIRLGELLVKLGYITELQLMRGLEKRLKVPYVDLTAVNIDAEVSKIVPEDVARKYNLLPLFTEGDMLIIAASDPTDLRAYDEVKLTTGRDISLVLSTPTDIKNAIEKIYSLRHVVEAAEVINKEFNISELNDIGNTAESELENAPVIKLVNSIIQQAYSASASDIHIEPMENITRVRIRIDGQLVELMSFNKNAHNSVIVRLKIIGGMDISERRLPQDGRVEATFDNISIDFRLSVLPTVYGEKAVIRILGTSAVSLSIEQLNISQSNMPLFQQLLKSVNGIILVSGPTGSGKTTSLYTLLKEFNRPEANIVTVEDPVEYRLSGISQVQVNTKAGLTFAAGLRSILRQDPDIIMIGEIRDAETAEIAVRAAVTGHLVLSTIHTNDASSTVMRLVDMGVDPLLVSSSMVGVIAQRLVRKVCPRCEYKYEADEHDCIILGLPPGSKPELKRGKGCPYCNNTGYKGRTAVHEIIVMNRELRALVDTHATVDALRDISKQHGTTSLMESCRKLVLDGITTVDELIKVTYSI